MSAPNRAGEAVGGEACIVNIGPRERRKRVRFGIVLLTVGGATAALLVGLGVNRPLRLLAFLPLFAGALGLFQAKEKTCVALVARNERNLDHGPEAVSDGAEQAQLRAQARKVYLESALAAAVLTALAFVLPSWR